ncbi:X-box-binding protein 1-like [Amphibalanus amphitrite]|uniref:X-box-binding protein 1-like n=1 Tax=Amphibalanus amphitrite TaxID=1232801 RepID=UPI001C922FFB|nr:X-box-binding protein 1-like [Amphibalanus amphitrite]XP_043216845.1 X-box-binding protein 1-like [Amphibalanus amphitrite]XP_043216846.1 X-box-binding protein 1-like [Amphibalanus amphitrite]
MTTKIIITPANHGVSKASALAGAPRTVRVVTVGSPPSSAGRGPQTRVLQATPTTTVSPAVVRTVLKRVYTSRPAENAVTTTTTTPALSGIMPSPPKKRQRLDHLTADQKNQRRKLKNRVAAQTARDRKKLQMDLLESRVTSLERQNDKLLQQNAFLQKQNELLSQQNALLLQRLEPAGAAAPTPASVESAALISGPQQKGQESGRAVAALLALSLLSWAGFQVALAATVTNTLICSSSSVARYSAAKSRREGTRPPPALLWWGPQQKSWSPAMIR